MISPQYLIFKGRAKGMETMNGSKLDDATPS